MAIYETALPVIIEHEGGFVNNIHDPGGATKYGISLRFLKRLGIDIDHDGDVDEADIKAMSFQDASEFYWDFFWYPGRFSVIVDQTVAVKLFDMAVNMGPRQADILCYRALEQPPVNVGELPMEILNAADGRILVPKLCEVQTDFYVALATNKPELKQFLEGWARRARWPFDTHKSQELAV